MLLESLDPTIRPMILARLRARGYDVGKLLSDERALLKALEEVLGRHVVELMQLAAGA